VHLGTLSYIIVHPVIPRLVAHDLCRRRLLLGLPRLSRKKLLLCQTPLARASRTSQNHLRAARLAALQVGLGQVGQRLDEDGAAVQAVYTPHALVALGVLADNLLVQLVQRLNVVTGEGNGDQQHVCLALLHQALDRVRCLCAQPWLRADLRLPHKTVLVLHAESLHDSVDGRSHFGRVRIATVDDRHGQTVGGEEQNDVVPAVRRVLCQLLLNVLCKGLDKPRVRWPAVNDTPVDGALGVDLARSTLALQSGAPLPELVERRASRRARVLGVLGEGDGPAALATTEPVSQQLVVHVLGQGICVAESNIGLVGSGRGRGLVEQLAHLGRLVFGPLPDGRAAANFSILLLDLGGSSSRKQRSNVVLESSEGNQVSVRLWGLACVVLCCVVGLGCNAHK
jgi:hypothetical protein